MTPTRRTSERMRRVRMGRKVEDSHGMPGPPCLHRARVHFAMHVGHSAPFLSREPFSSDLQS